MAKEIKLDYYTLTASGHAPQAFQDKVLKIMQLSSQDREIIIGDMSCNINAEFLDKNQLFIGVFSGIRGDAPNKRKFGENMTSRIPLATDEGINENTFFVYDLARNLLAMTYNHHGPRIGRLLNYINSIYKERILQADEVRERLSYLPVIVGNKIETIFQSGRIKAVCMRPKNPVSSGFVPNDATWQELFGAFDTPGQSSVEFIIKDKGMDLTKFLRGLLSKQREYTDEFDKLQINFQDEDGVSKKEDLIANRLTRSIYAPYKDGSKELDGNAILKDIEADLRKVEQDYYGRNY